MSERIDYDGAWKEVLEDFLRPLVELFFPEAGQSIDWRISPQFLNTELQRIVPDSELGKQHVDRLVEVRRLDGNQELVLLHLEVQSQPDDDLSKRMYQYHHRIVDHQGRAAATLVILADKRKERYRPCYETELWGCRLRFEYPICKLLDLKPGLDKLEAAGNPVAIIIAAQLETQATYRNLRRRKTIKKGLTLKLGRLGFSETDARKLFRFIDHLMILPEKLDVEFRREIEDAKREKPMPYITTIERAATEKGLKQGRQEEAARLLVRLARKRFNQLGPQDESIITQLPLTALESLSEALLDFAGIEQLRQWLSDARRDVQES